MHVHQVIALCCLVASVSPAGADHQATPETIMALESEWSDMYSAGDLEGVMSLMADESVLIVPGLSPLVGPEEIRAGTAAMLASGDKVSWRSDFAFVAPSGDMAYDYGSATTVTAAGETISGNYLVVWVKQDGRWKVAADMFN